MPSLDVPVQISGFVKLKLAICAWAGDALGFNFHHQRSVGASPAGDAWLQRAHHRRSLLPNCIFNAVAVRSNAFLHGRLGSIKRVAQAAHVFFPVIYKLTSP
jgi:hypothetical protein